MGLDTGGKCVPDLAGKWAKMEKVNQTRARARWVVVPQHFFPLFTDPFNSGNLQPTFLVYYSSF